MTVLNCFDACGYRRLGSTRLFMQMAHHYRVIRSGAPFPSMLFARSGMGAGAGCQNVGRSLIVAFKIVTNHCCSILLVFLDIFG